MSQITLTLTQRPRQPIDARGLTPTALGALGLEAVKALPLKVGNRSVALGSLFEVETRPAAAPRLIFRGETQGIEGIGRDLEAGHIEVEGSAGSYVGQSMRGGSLRVQGSIEAYGACELRGGVLEVLGDAGDFLGAALPGNAKGMSGGVVLVRGSAGDRVGDHLRRGLIVIEGGAGDYLGARMKAGSILVQGAVGAFPGYAMNRGSLLLATPPKALLPTFRDCGSHTLGFIPLLLNSLTPHQTVFRSLAPRFSRIRRYAGDFSALGKGELIHPLEA